jgi:O-antigen/teichoic acid export membrane protein
MAPGKSKNPIKELAGQTLLYGLATIVPRFLNYVILTPFYTRILPLASYGVVTELYAYIAVLLVLLTYGMETAYFRFANKSENKTVVFSTSVINLGITSLLFLGLVILFLRPIANVLEYSGHPEYIILFSIIVAIDAFSAVFFAKLRLENKGFLFGIIKMVNVLVIILIVFMYLYIIPHMLEKNPESILRHVYDKEIGVGYVFIANLAGSLISLIWLFFINREFRFVYDRQVIRKMLVYGLPLMIAGLFGILNDSFDKIILKHFYTVEEGLKMVAIYGGNYKIAVLMTLFIQMFRYAVEPFFFRYAGRKKSKELYAAVMRYFILFGFVIYLGILVNIDIVKQLVDREYWVGLKIVPVVLAANLMFGIFVNLSVWYKINDLTKYAILLNGAGLFMTLLINILFIPTFGYMASAWGHVVAMTTMVGLSWFIGKKKYPVRYQLKKISIHTVIFVLFAGILFVYPPQGEVLRIFLYNVVLLLMVQFIYFKERKKLIERTWETE